MATPRKHWLRLYESILDEDWDDATLATVIRLMCWLNRRWARNGIEHAKAGDAFVPTLQLMTICRQRRPERATARLTVVAQCVTMDVAPCAGGVNISWPKFSELQDYGPRHSPGDRVVTARSIPSPTPTPTPRREELRKEPPVVPLEGDAPTALELQAAGPKRRGRQPAAKSHAPERLAPEQVAALRHWCLEHEDPAVNAREPWLARLVEGCLDHHRAKGSLMADWPAACRTWIKNDCRFNPDLPKPPVNGAHKEKPWHELSPDERREKQKQIDARMEAIARKQDYLDG